MSDRLWMAALVYPAPLYAGLFVLYRFPGDGIGFPLGFLLALVFGSATAVGLVRHPVWVSLGRFLLVLVVLVPVATGPGTGGAWLDLSAGVIVGAPFLWLEYAWRDASSPTARIVALQSVFLVGILCLATLAESSSTTGGSTGWRFVQALGQVTNGQIQGIAAALTGTTPAGIPFETTFNVVYAGLGGIALVGVILSWISPRTAHDEPLPWSWVRSYLSRSPIVPTSEELGLRPGQRDALATQTFVSPPESVLAPGFGSLLVAGILMVGFVTVAVAVPTYALLAVVLGTVAALAAVASVLSRRLTPLGGLAG